MDPFTSRSLDDFRNGLAPIAGRALRSGSAQAPLCVGEGKGLSTEGAPLSHELLNIECGHFCHSWICGGMEEDFARRKQVKLNGHGYIESFETARECADMINRGEVRGAPPPY